MRSGREHAAGLASRAPNVLGVLPRLTQNSYRQAVGETVTSLAACNGSLSDQDMADLLGTSAATVGNARNRKGDLNAVTLMSIGRAFGPHALNTVAALIGAKVVPANAMCVEDVSRIPLKIAEALPMLIALLSDGECCDGDVRDLERAGVIDVMIQTANMLSNRREQMRLKAVNT